MKTGTSSLTDRLMGGLFRWLTRIVLLLTALVFFICLLTVATGLLLVWGVRALWARLLGRPVTPWVFRVDPRAHWSGFGQPAGRGPLPQRGPQSPRGPISQRGPTEVTDVTEVKDVTDVIPRDIKNPEKPTDRVN